MSTEDNASDGEVAQLQPDHSTSVQEEASAKDREGALLKERQAKDPELIAVIQYLETGELPAEEKKAKEIILGKARYTLIDGILYHVGMDKSLQIVLPRQDRYNIGSPREIRRAFTGCQDTWSTE